MEVLLKSIPKEEIDQNWPIIIDWLRNALGVDKSYNINDIKIACEKGAISLWIIYINGKETGFVTTIIKTEPQGLACYAPWLGGENLDSWVKPGFEQLKIALKEKNCISISWIGRPVWKKLVNVDSAQCFYLINL